MEEPVNKLLLRQIKKHLNGTTDDETLLPLLKAVEETYNFYEEDRKLLERSMELSSKELNEANEKLARENEAQKATLDKLQTALKSGNKTSDGKAALYENLSLDQLIDALIEARDQAEASSKIKEQFLSNMSHEIRTPMNGVIGMTNLILQTDLNSEQLGYINAIKFSTDNLLVIINDILDFSKIESGKIELESLDFNLENIINGVIKTVKFKADEKGLRISKTLDADLPQLIVGDPVRYNQVMLNLIGNAIKFTETGRVSILVEKIEETDTHVVISTEITDTGIGIAEEQLETIFESFTQASSKTTRKYGGTGLGLAISKQLVELQDGIFEVESELGRGSTFRFNLPFLKADLSAIVERKEIKSFDGKLPNDFKVLLVEDNRINVEVAAKLLHKWNADITIDHAENGEMALVMFNKKAYDLVLMDLQMPVKDGYETAISIREMAKPKCDTPIIALSASAFRAEQQRVFDVGMNDFVSKPFVPEELFAKIIQHAVNK